MAYDADPARARVPLTPDDVEALLLTDGRELAGDPANVRHLLQRLRATFAAQLELERGFTRERERWVDRTRREQDPRVAAIEALTKLDEDQQLEVMGHAVSTRLEQAQALAAAGRAAQLAADSQTNLARMVLHQIVADAAVSDEGRDHARRALAQLAPVRHPGASGEQGSLPDRGDGVPVVTLP